MSEKPIAAVLTGIGVVSLCAVCALGPAALGSAAGWAIGWVTDLSPMATVGAGIFTALVAYAVFRRRGAARPRGDSEMSTLSHAAERENH